MPKKKKKTKDKPYHFIIELTTFPYSILVCFGHTTEDIIKILKRCDFKPEDYQILIDSPFDVKAECYWLQSKRQVIIRYRLDYEINKGIGYIAHESFHAATFILHAMGVKFEMDISDEVYAYITEYIVQQTIAGMRK